MIEIDNEQFTNRDVENQWFSVRNMIYKKLGFPHRPVFLQEGRSCRQLQRAD